MHKIIFKRLNECKSENNELNKIYFIADAKA